MAASRRPLLFLWALVAVVGLQIATMTAASAANPAGDPVAVAKVTNLNRKALEAYGKQDYTGARDYLKQALELCDSAHLDQHPITARTHIHFGAVAIVGYQQRELGLKHFRMALAIEPTIKLTKSIATPELQDAFEEAVLASNGKGPSGRAATADNSGGDQGGGAAAAANSDDQGSEAAGDEDADRPRRALRARPRRHHHHADLDEEGDDDDDTGDDTVGTGQQGTIYLGVTIGSSAGIASGSGHMNPAHTVGTGFAVGQLGQIEPQIGMFLSPTMLLSLVARLQYVSGLNGENQCGPNGNLFCNPLTMVGAALVRTTFLLGDGPFHFTVGAQIGGGYVAHAVVFSDDTKCGSSMSTAGNTQCVDALLGGPFLIGPTAGLMWELGDVANLVAGINTELGAPKFTFNFDLDVGLAFRL